MINNKQWYRPRLEMRFRVCNGGVARRRKVQRYSLFFLLAALGGEVWRETGCQSEVRLR